MTNMLTIGHPIEAAVVPELLSPKLNKVRQPLRILMMVKEMAKFENPLIALFNSW